MTTSSRDTKMQIEGLATLLVLDDEIRKLATLREFGFFTTNETHRLIPYHTASLWQKSRTGITLLAQAGTADVDQAAPLNQWLKNKIHSLSLADSAKEIWQGKLVTENTGEQENPADVVWREALPENFLWCPLFNPRGDLTGGLIYFRETPFSEPEIKMLGWLIGSYQYAWRYLTRKTLAPFWQELGGRRLVMAGLVALVIIALFPVRLSVLGNATVTAQDPVLINAPLQGVIKKFNVSPGDHVKANQLLLTLDKTDLESDEKVSLKEFQLTESKLRTAINQQLAQQQTDNTPESGNAEIPVLQAQLEIDRAHLEYTRAMLAKADIRSPIDGIVVFDSKEDWIGQPVQTGERILAVANPDRVQLRISLPVANAIRLKANAEGNFFPFGQLHSLPVIITTPGYNARLTPAKILAYQLEAKFVNSKDHPQLGAEGTVRIYGNRVPLIYYLLRRPLEALRQSFGV